MPPSIYARSWYQATASQHKQHPPLRGDVTADVCIIGAGYTGLSAALELARAGFRTIVLEAEHVGHGASGRNGGQVCTGFSSGQDRIAAQLGNADARRCFALAEESKALLKERIETNGIECDLTWGYYHALPKPGRFDGLKAWKDEWDELGYTNTRLVPKSELEQVLDTRCYHGALHEGGAGHLHALNYCLGLARAAESAGAVIHEKSAAVSVDTGARPVVKTELGSVSAKYLLICCNAYLGRLVPALHGRVMPVTSYIIATEPLGAERAGRLIKDNGAVADTNFIVDYFRLTSDHRMLFGGRASYAASQPANLTESMRARMLRVFPQLSDVKIEFTWGGFIAITSNRIPDCGRLTPTTFYAHGYSGQGVALSGLYGKLMAEAIRGTAERFDLLSRIKHLPFPGGPVRMPILATAMLYYRIKDALS
jgi:gamma-glutamylputrescine oxidase